MAATIPDLWRSEEDAERLYQLYLCRLEMNGMHQQIVKVCPLIRRYATRGPGARAGLFTFSLEIDSLCHLKRYETAWRRLRRREEIVFGRRLDLRRREWTIDDASDLEFYYAPLLFFLGRHRQGCGFLETSLSFWFTTSKVASYELLTRVYNEDTRPTNRCRVTLSHFYTRLGKRLIEWQYWERFVAGLHPRLFRLAGIRRDELFSDPAQLPKFYNQLMQEREQRTPTGVGGSLSDLVDSASKVQRRQKAIERRLKEFHLRTQPARECTNAKLSELFPELQSLPE